MNIATIKKRLLADIERLKTPEGYLRAGYPGYHTLFGRDSLISSWQMLSIDPSIARSTLEILAGYQGKIINPKSEEEPGKILHEFRFTAKEQAQLSHWTFPYFGSVDSTPLFVIVAHAYFQKTKDEDFIARIWENLIAAVEWIVNDGDRDQDYFIEYARKNPYGLFHQGWRDSAEDHLRVTPPVALVEAQGYVYAAYIAFHDLAKVLKKESDFAKEAVARARTLKDRFHTYFWMPQEKYYALALDGEKSQRKAISSNPGHLLFTGILPLARARLVVRRLFESDLLTPYGIRTHSALEPDFDPSSYQLGSVWPHDNWIIYHGCMKMGFQRETLEMKKRMLEVYREFGCIPELFGVVDNRAILLEGKKFKANRIQAWASAGLLEMIWNDKQ